VRIGQLARATGVSADTLRYYERIGLFPRVHRAANGYRDYSAGVVSRIRVIRNAVQLGFPLNEIARVLKVRDQGGSPCRQVRDYADSLITQLDQRIAQLQADRRAMAAIVRDWDDKLARTQPGARAHLLECPGMTMTRSRSRGDRLRGRR
jgi:DNA-binding transcriptional MerR regulator